MKTPHLLMPEMLPVLRQFCVGPYGIAIGGSYAKGNHDALSDLDVYVFAHQIQLGPQRSELLAQKLIQTSEVNSWGCEDPFIEGGTDFSYQGCRVECWLRNMHQVEDTLASCMQGQIRREYVAWTIMGFFNYGVLADVQTMQVMDDPHGILARWKGMVRTYPEPLRRAILDRFTREAAFWPENFHYRIAVERVDTLYIDGIIRQVVYALMQALFALNREYFLGEKRLLTVLDELPVKPNALSSRVQALLYPGKDSRVTDLQKQRNELRALITEMQELVLALG
jgi:hypothetical protein